MFVADRAEHGAHAFVFHFSGAVGDGLIQQRERIAHAARRALGQMAQGRRFKADAFGFQYARQMIDDAVSAASA